jgi:NAD(P)-dependent dehydrogenase (short-subunit alcohol dehydrogenase family)
VLVTGGIRGIGRVSCRIVELNLLAPLHISQQANPVMQAQRDGGSIIMG